LLKATSGCEDRTSTPRLAERAPKYHTLKMQGRLQELGDHLRADIEHVDEPKLKAMFETAAEVLDGLQKAFP
jgi:hypothetical protein